MEGTRGCSSHRHRVQEMEDEPAAAPFMLREMRTTEKERGSRWSRGRAVSMEYRVGRGVIGWKLPDIRLQVIGLRRRLKQTGVWISLNDP